MTTSSAALEDADPPPYANSSSIGLWSSASFTSAPGTPRGGVGPCVALLYRGGFTKGGARGAFFGDERAGPGQGDALITILTGQAGGMPWEALAGTIAVVTFVTAYIPFIGAFISGAFAVVITLGSEGSTTALACTPAATGARACRTHHWVSRA